MWYRILEVIALLVSGLMVGNELTVAVFLHPTLKRLPGEDPAARRAFASLFGRAMPFWYVLVLLLSAATFFLGPPLTSVDGKLLLAATVLWAIAIVFTLLWPAPLNSRIAAWNVQSLPPEWRQQGRRWDRLHAIRMVMLLAALVCLVVGAVISA